MATLTVRNLDDDVYEALKARASDHDRSMEAEAREILAEATHPIALWSALTRLREETGGIDMEIPPRTMPREIDLS